MEAADEFFDFALVMRQERIHVVLVEQARALGLREDEVGEEEETKPAIEWDPKSD